MILCLHNPTPPTPPPTSSSTVFHYAEQFNAPIGNWDVSRVANMRYSKNIRVLVIVVLVLVFSILVCDHVHLSRIP